MGNWHRKEVPVLWYERSPRIRTPALAQIRAPEKAQGPEGMSSSALLNGFIRASPWHLAESSAEETGKAEVSDLILFCLGIHR